MADPIIEKIAAELQDRINEITTANGFQQDLTCVRPKRVGFEGDGQAANGKVILISGDPELDEENSTEGNPAALAWIHPFDFVVFVIASDTSTAPIDTRIQRARADIEKKLRADPTRGDLAIDTRIMPPARFADGPASTGIVVSCLVLYRTSEDDPYTQA